MLEVVYGQTRKQMIADRVLAVLQPLNITGTVYIGYPVLASADEPISIDALLVCKEHGLIAFVFESTAPAKADASAWAKLRDQQDRVYFAIKTNLARHEALRKGRELPFSVNVVTVFPALPETPDTGDLQVADVAKLADTLGGFGHLPLEYEKPLNAALQRVSTLRPPRKRTSVTTPHSRGGILRKLEEEIANLDKWQKAATIESPDGPQRIRGIAGSGKTVVLALKASYLHVVNPEWTIVVTFHTRSLYDQFQDLIRRFTIEQTGSEPDWSKLRVMHAWGGVDRDGVYTEMATASGVTPRNFVYGKTSYGSRGAFAGVCRELLASASQREIEPIFDAVLIDEAQDLPEAFFHLIYRYTRVPKRIVWAYDELQNLSEASVPPLEDLFGRDKSGNPRVKLSEPNGYARQDVILPVCYRNTPWALTLAHALGFGIYREGGLIQHFDDATLWEEIGYGVVEGQLSPAKRVLLERRSDSYPDYFRDLLTREDAVVCRTFDNEEEQGKWVADSILTNLDKDELEKDDILIVLPNAITAKRDASRLIEALTERGIDSHLAGVTQSRDKLFDRRSVAIANIFRAKGNEAPMVYVLNSQYCFSGFELITLRNILFTAITRSRAWVRLCGWGSDMDRLAKEVEKVRKHNFRLEFTIPTDQELTKMRMIHRELTEAERAKRNRAQKGLSEALQALERGDLPIESLPPDIRTKLAKLIDSLETDEDDA